MFLEDMATPSQQVLAVILLIICILPLAVLIVCALVVRIKNASRKKKENKETNRETDEEQRDLFFAALGGKDNYLSSKKERNKIFFTVKDPASIDGEKLKELGATGVLIVGNEIKASFGDRVDNIYAFFEEKEKS